MCIECEKSLPNQIVFDKIESIIRLMQDEQNGLPVKTAKSFMSKIPSVFTGTDLIQWMMRNLRLEDQQEAVHLANLIASHGYIFPIEDHTLSIKNDCTFYRFQTPCLWPSNNSDPENTDYAVYLCKRTMQGKTRLELADYEAENLARLQKMFSRKWEFIFMQAESQAKVDKKRDKLERKVLDSQERAFWDVYRPVPGCVNTTELDIKKACRLSKSAKRCGECKKVAAAQSGPQVAPSPELGPAQESKPPGAVPIVKESEHSEAQVDGSCLALDSSGLSGANEEPTRSARCETTESPSDSRSQNQAQAQAQDSSLGPVQSQSRSESKPNSDRVGTERASPTHQAGGKHEMASEQQVRPAPGQPSARPHVAGQHPHQHQHHHHHHHHHPHPHPHPHPHQHQHQHQHGQHQHHHQHGQHQHHHHHHRQCPHHKHHQQATNESAAGGASVHSSEASAKDSSGETPAQNPGRVSPSSKKRSIGSADQFIRAPSLQGVSSRRKSECNRMLSMNEQSLAIDDTLLAAQTAPTAHSEGVGGQRPASACCSLTILEKGRTSDGETAANQRPASVQSSNQAQQQMLRKSSLNILRTPDERPLSGARKCSIHAPSQHSPLKGTQSVYASSSNSELTSGGQSQDVSDLERELEALKIRLDRRIGGVKMSKVTQSYLSYFKQWAEYDPFIAQPIPSNPWISDSTELWDSERQTKDVHCRRVRRWAFSLKELLNDPAGREQFHRFLEKEFSAENLKFWDAVQELKRVHSRDVARRVEAIWTEYLAQDANCPINIDSKSYETSKKNMAKNKNNRYIFDEAAGHVYQLMKNDSYPRYLRSDMYKDYKEASEKKRTNQVAFDVFKPQITTLKHKFNF